MLQWTGAQQGSYLKENEGVEDQRIDSFLTVLSISVVLFVRLVI